MRIFLVFSFLIGLVACQSNPSSFIMAPDPLAKSLASDTYLSPDPSGHIFRLGEGWTTFTVNTDLDSVLVVVNPDNQSVLEIEGGSNPPRRNYCPAEGRDRPADTRKDGYKVHITPCASGETTIQLRDYDGGLIVEYKVYAAAEGETVDTGFNIAVHVPKDWPANIQKAFKDAAARWEEIIVGDLPDVCVNYNPEIADVLPVDSEVDDLVVIGRTAHWEDQDWVGSHIPEYRAENRALVIVVSIPLDFLEAEEFIVNDPYLQIDFMRSIGHGLGLVPTDVSSEEGPNQFFSGKNALAVWKKKAPASYAQSIPVEWGLGLGRVDRGRWSYYTH